LQRTKIRYVGYIFHITLALNTNTYDFGTPNADVLVDGDGTCAIMKLSCLLVGIAFVLLAAERRVALECVPCAFGFVVRGGGGGERRGAASYLSNEQEIEFKAESTNNKTMDEAL
jgi:hypothetical protein